jgi:hypothetical protein
MRGDVSDGTSTYERDAREKSLDNVRASEKSMIVPTYLHVGTVTAVDVIMWGY